jgi:YD repeat-containing protein
LTGGYAGASRDLRPSKEVSIIFEPNAGSALASMSETVYDTNDTIGSTDEKYFSSLNAKQTKTYNYITLSLSDAENLNIDQIAALFSSTNLASTSEADYLYDANYKARNIVGLVTETRVKDASGTVKAKSQISYDESSYALASTGSMPTAAADSWVDLTSSNELGATVGSKRGLPTTVKKYYDITGSQYITTHAFYDQFGNLRKAQDGRAKEGTVAYSADYAFAYPTSSTTPAPADSVGTYGATTGFTTTSTFDYNTGLPLTNTDPNGLTAVMEYDAYLRPYRTTPKLNGNTVGSVTETTYGIPGTSGQYLAAQRFVKTRAQNDASNWKEGYTWFDGLGRTVKSQSVDSQGDVFTETEYDSMGRVKRSTNPYRANETKQWTTPTYDDLGRTLNVTSPDSSAVYIAYGLSTSAPIGTTKTVTDQAGKKRSGIADALGRMTRVIEDPTSQNLVTDYVFDTLGNLRKTIQGSQNRYFMYDALGRLLYAKQPEQDANTSFSGTSYTDPVTSNNQWSVKYQYDNNGNITSTTDARNVSVTGTYDNLNRLILRDYSDSTPDVNFYYDGTGLGSVPAYSKGKTTRVSSSVSETRYTSFDIMGRVLTNEQRTTAGQLAGTEAVYVFSYAYNLSGTLTEETYPSGRIVKNVLNNDGELSIVQSKKNANQGFFNYAKNFSYNSSGAAEKMQMGNGYWETAVYNNRLQVQQLGLGKVDNTQDLLKLEYSFNTPNTNDNNGSLRSHTITIPTTGSNAGFTAIQNYTYDSLNRLESAAENVSSTQTWKQTFSYDRFGNRTFNTNNNNTTTLGSCAQAICNPAISTTVFHQDKVTVTI